MYEPTDYKLINLDQLRNQSANYHSKIPFQHQIEAFEALSKTFKFGSEKPGSGILVLPTGAGKTFTAVRWLSDHVIPKNIKILWLAPSFYLLDQAFDTFEKGAKDIPEPKKTLNIRCVSSNPSHAKASSIQLTDDIVIMTIQTAINNLHTDALDRFGNKFETAFKKFIDYCRETGLFVVVDEAHHSPAYGCRNLLIGEKDSALGLRGLFPQLNLLGLTATPTYNDKARRGWLWKIFENEIIYEAKKESLILQGILAKSNYIEVSTGKEWEIDDGLYERLVKQHKDLPESIIEKLATDKPRNNFIADAYVSNKDSYGKTIIFADRWFQCIYIKEKLLEKGVRVDAIYSHIDADPGSADARNKRTQSDNQRILDEFKNNKLDVLINVRMLTEGADIPNVKTVFITRQTTSSILMTQMIGRALRGEKVGGSAEANIVLFFDDWKRLVDWANPKDSDTIDKEKVSVKGYYPLEYISIRLVEELSKSIESGGDYQIEYKKICPIGWYKTEIVYANVDNQHELMESFTEFVMVYEHTKSKLDSFILFIRSTNLLDEWSKEYLDDKWMQSQVQQWISDGFERKTDNIGGKLDSDLIKIVRHIAQNQSVPIYHPFEERELYDLDKIAYKVIDFPPRLKHEYLDEEFSKSETLWKVFYKSLIRFETAVDAAIINIIYQPTPQSTLTVINLLKTEDRELTEVEKEEVKARDRCTCLCCGVNTKGKLQIDHIKPFSMGGKTSIENSQTLCVTCNRCKGQNEIDFRCNTTKLINPKNLDLSFISEGEKAIKTITRVVNFFYHCKAVSKIDWEVYTYTYNIYLYPSNNPEWLLKHKAELLNLIQNKLGCHAEYINVTTMK
ncbi:DEAD/DEAH box helicase family protein [Halotia branconii]|uniref:DEAD/DEAH box helicase family protein n=1 Tax=Halotia branconii CENA392 TaxID=1539056 RepID=A0AAJ6P840_9CYAN|nr:DEAD/DEAH box helicase family protein [Halotia branconii]WGV24237.1 DEAD/DEAH box helicase family protein [Halotia branconii CENA392]